MFSEKKLNALLFDISVGKNVVLNLNHYLIHYEPTIERALLNKKLSSKRICCWIGIYEYTHSLECLLLKHSKLWEMVDRKFVCFMETVFIFLESLKTKLDHGKVKYTFLKGAWDLTQSTGLEYRKFTDIDIVIAREHLILFNDICASIAELKKSEIGINKNEILQTLEFTGSAGTVNIKLDIHLNSYGVFPHDFPISIYSIHNNMGPLERCELIFEEWLVDAQIRAQDVNDLKRLRDRFFSGSSEILLSNIKVDIFKHISKEIFSRYFCETPQFTLSNHLVVKLMVNRFLDSNGRNPWFFGAHWLRCLILFNRLQFILGKRGALIEVTKYLIRMYIVKIRKRYGTTFTPNLLNPIYLNEKQ